MLPARGGYINSFAYKDKKFDWLFIPSEFSGNSSLPVGDYLMTPLFGSLYLPLLGGFWNDGTRCGPFSWDLMYDVGYKNKRLGSRLIYLPTNQ